jgi:hypothetical protein
VGAIRADAYIESAPGRFVDVPKSANFVVAQRQVPMLTGA